ncbi:MAG TPA: VWA domain-containing protein [Terriglobales bacterium]|nr:VWA domain-containing protein [Terriglobales bacterium]
MSKISSSWRTPSSCFLLFALLLSLTPCSLSQTLSTGAASSGSSEGEAAETTPTFHASTRLVLVDVVVTDKSGKPVRGLTEKDFTILQDGKPQPISAFEAHVWRPLSAKLEKINLPPDQYTNFTEQGPNSAVNVVLLDVLNTPQQDQQYARKQMIQFLRELPPGQKVALFVLGTKLRMMQGFSGSSDRLTQAAESILSNTSPVLTTNSQYQDAVSDIAFLVDAAASAQGGPDSSLKARLISALDAQVTFQNDVRSRKTLDAIAALAGAVSGYSGRKNLFWLSGGFPFLLGPDFSNDPLLVPDNYGGAIRETAALLLAAQIAVYPIDVRGVQTTNVSASASTQMELSSATDQVSLAQKMRYNDYTDTKGTMDDIARETGGQAFIGNDIKNMMERAMEQGSTYYTIAFSPIVKKWDGEYHKI